MNHYLFLIALLTSLLLSLPQLALASQPVHSHLSKPSSSALPKPLSRQGYADYVPGELLVKFKNADNPASASISNSGKTRQKHQTALLKAQNFIKRKTAKYKVSHRKNFSRLGVEYWKLNKGENLKATIDALKADPDVLLVEPNYRRYPRFLNPGSALTFSAASLSQIKIMGKEGAGGYDGLRDLASAPVLKDPVVAIIDDGFDISHPDLSNKFVSAYDALDKDFDPSPQYTCPNTDPAPNTNAPEIEGHGTQVMGVLGANGTGVHGVSESRQIIPIRVGCDYSLVAELAAINWAIDNNAEIINMSYGGPQFSEFQRQAIYELEKKNILVVTAAGNFHISNDRVPDYPSGLDLPNIIAVAALDSESNLADWTQFGQTSVDIAAPGGSDNIAAPFPGNQYVQTSGTSFSAPFVSGVAASLMARHPNARANDVKAAILASAAPFKNNLKARLATDGYVDALAAHELLESGPKPVPLIKQIYIDDSQGNGNSQVDEDESVELVVIVENIWADADTLTSLLKSTDLGITGISRQNFSLKGYDPNLHEYGSVELRFPVDFSNRTQRQGLLFTLELSGRYESNTKEFSYERTFTIDTGSLNLGEPIQSVLKTHDQDEVHYYYVTLPERKGDLVFTLDMLGTETAYNANLLVKFSEVPQFDFSSYESSSSEIRADSVSRGTFMSTNGGLNSEQLVFENAAAGTYFIAVASSKITSATNIVYKLGVELKNTQPLRNTISGCTVGNITSNMRTGATSIDPLLPLMVVFSVIFIVLRDKRANFDKNPRCEY